MIYSKTMRVSDYNELGLELQMVDGVLSILGGGDPAQHVHRRWEYAMALKAFNQWRYNKYGDSEKPPVVVADHGCCTGMLAPMLYYFGHDIRMYEIWAWGNQEAKAIEQMNIITARGDRERTGKFQMINRPLNGLTDADRGMDASFCISTMEHIPNFETAFRDLCRTVGPGGLLFMTTDSAEDEIDHYMAAHVRAGTMFNKTVYEKLTTWGREEGFELLNGQSDWSWDSSCRLVNDYGFACLAMERPVPQPKKGKK